MGAMLLSKLSRVLGRHRLALLGASSLLLLLMGASCAEGSYPVDIFFEMHYQPSYGSQEPPRLSPPEGSVAWFAAGTPNRTGAGLFATNCAMCHGLDGKGDGPVLRIMESKYGYTPALTPDLTSDFVQNQGADALGGIISGGLVVMPPFEKLLSEEERTLLVEYILGDLASP